MDSGDIGPFERFMVDKGRAKEWRGDQARDSDRMRRAVKGV
jgi:hypothetical protein